MAVLVSRGNPIGFYNGDVKKLSIFNYSLRMKN